MSIGLETWGYPEVTFMGKNENGSWIRITEGWFLPDEWEDEPACYLEIHINDKQQITIELNWLGIIYFDFETPLDDYLIPCSKTMTIGDWYKKVA